MNSEEMIQRGSCHSMLRRELEKRGSALLHAKEKELLLDAADAQLFQEEQASEKLQEALDMLTQLEDSEREAWTPELIEIIRNSLKGCGETSLVRS
jgi:hypothetical protein